MHKIIANICLLFGIIFISLFIYQKANYKVDVKVLVVGQNNQILEAKRGYLDEEPIAPDIEGYTIERIRKDLEQIIFRVNDRLVNTTPRTGTTIVLLILVKNEYEVLWAGDSRCYRLSRKEPDVLIRLTEDHVWENDSGFTEGLTEKEIAEHKFRGRITNALGLRRPGRIDRISGKADSGEAFILCSDGIYKYADEEVLFECGRNLMETDLLETVSEDIRREVSRNGAGDNHSLLLVRVS